MKKFGILASASVLAVASASASFAGSLAGADVEPETVVAIEEGGSGSLGGSGAIIAGVIGLVILGAALSGGSDDATSAASAE